MERLFLLFHILTASKYFQLLIIFGGAAQRRKLRLSVGLVLPMRPSACGVVVLVVYVVCPSKAGTPGQKYLQVVALGTPAWKGTTTTPRSVVGQCG